MAPQTTHTWLPRVKTLTVRFLPIGFGATVLTFFVIGAVDQTRSKEAGSVFWIILLFSIPLFVQGCALIFMVRRVNWCYYFFNLTVTTICFGFCFYFWVRYFDNQQNGERLQALSYRTLWVILALLIAVGVMTYAIMRPSSDHLGGEFCNQLNTGVRQHPFWAIMFFFTLFVGVAYLFGFTLAFHDKYALTKVDKDDPERHRPALRMANLKSIDDLSDAKPQTVDGGETDKAGSIATPQPAQSPSVPDADPKVNKFSFYFKSGGARLGKETPKTCNESSPPRRQWNRTPSGPKDTEEFNDCNLKALVKRIRDETDIGKRVRVTLIGHGDSDPVSRAPLYQNSKSLPLLRYLSNYELSEARAQTVKYEILRMFPDTEKWHNVEWLTLPASNEDIREIPTGLINKDLFEVNELAGKFTPDEIVKGITPEQLTSRVPQEVLLAKLYARLTPERVSEESRVVLASVNPVPSHIASLQMKQINQEMDPRVLGLMDYMYFSVYTITTTGYGDIVPTTAYAKFVTSLANFCEVLFLVVFFNALISLKGNPPVPNAAQSNPSVPAVPSDADVKVPDGGAMMNVLRGPFTR